MHDGSKEPSFLHFKPPGNLLKFCYPSQTNLNVRLVIRLLFGFVKQSQWKGMIMMTSLLGMIGTKSLHSFEKPPARESFEVLLPIQLIYYSFSFSFAIFSYIKHKHSPWYD